MKRIFAIFLAAVLLCGCSQTGNNETTPTESDAAAPDFTMYTLDGKAVKLSDFEGKPTILNFWASWCGPCKSEMPELEAAYLAYGDQIHFAMVNLTDGTNDTIAAASGYIREKGYTFPVYYDTELAGAAAYGVSSIPLTIFINARGEMVAYHTGSMTEDVLQRGINLLLPATE